MKKYSSLVIVIIVHSTPNLVCFPVMLVIYHGLKTPSNPPPALTENTCTHGDSNEKMIKLNSLGG